MGDSVSVWTSDWVSDWLTDGVYHGGVVIGDKCDPGVIARGGGQMLTVVLALIVVLCWRLW